MPPRPHRRDVAQLARGVLMGAADTVPGVSGGTVALVLGIYTRLVTAVSRVDGTLVRLLRGGNWRGAADYLDVRFLGWLLAGVGLGVVTLAGLTRAAMEERYTLTFALFFGLIAGSVVLVGRLVDRWTPLRAGLLVGGAAAAFFLVGIDALENPPIGPAYLFACGSVAICAMILPGVSGSFLLLVLGAYHHVTGWVKRGLGGDLDGATLLEMAAFFAGMVLGLGLFSKLLRWLLARYNAATLAILAGAMLGSLRRLWPFVEPRPAGIEFKEWQPVRVLPAWDDGGTLLALAVAAGGFVAVLVLDRLGRARAEDDPGEIAPADDVEPPPKPAAPADGEPVTETPVGRV